MENANIVLTLSCKDCMKSGYIENMDAADVRYCPQCGSDNITVILGCSRLD